MAVSCALTADYNFSCDVGAGGVIEAYFIEKNNVTSFTESSGTLTAITKATGKVFRKYQLVVETASFDENLQGNVQNGTLFADQKGVIIINKQSVAVRNELMLLGRNTLIAVFKDQNLSYRLFGRENGLRVESGAATTGTSLADRNGYTINFSGKEPELAPFVLDAVIATLQTPGA